MSPRIDCVVSQSVWRALDERRFNSDETLSEIVDALLSEALDLERHSLFQVSTSNALVQGVFGGTATVGDLLRHGDFGLGTFAALDGEMIVVDGKCFRATAGGAVSLVNNDLEVPFAAITRFVADLTEELLPEVDLPALTSLIDTLRPSQNLFVGIRVDGLFDDLTMRAACRAGPGEGLVEATGHQSEFRLSDAEGTLVGFWSPEYSRSVSVPGYHLHFISDDRTSGGHVRGLKASGLTVRLHTESDLHLALPESVEFLTADLTGDHHAELDQAESERKGS